MSTLIQKYSEKLTHAGLPWMPNEENARLILDALEEEGYFFVHRQDGSQHVIAAVPNGAQGWDDPRMLKGFTLYRRSSRCSPPTVPNTVLTAAPRQAH
ncbi:hypothetical protein H4R18_004689 [Coemansia javaensis]|uniref:Uncharacterized protein n=1 Tax=Coemansia javaensis TaxID=2761396 RepID=A0A9W8H8Q5_9FUNG|nr:hypothetical protein H4R18_004689 [Coemansia javaensis]